MLTDDAIVRAIFDPGHRDLDSAEQNREVVLQDHCAASVCRKRIQSIGRLAWSGEISFAEHDPPDPIGDVYRRV
jgi:hypothetical protein